MIPPFLLPKTKYLPGEHKGLRTKRRKSKGFIEEPRSCGCYYVLSRTSHKNILLGFYPVADPFMFCVII